LKVFHLFQNLHRYLRISETREQITPHISGVRQKSPVFQGLYTHEDINLTIS